MAQGEMILLALAQALVSGAMAGYALGKRWWASGGCLVAAAICSLIWVACLVFWEA